MAVWMQYYLLLLVWFIVDINECKKVEYCMTMHGFQFKAVLGSNSSSLTIQEIN